MRLRATIYPILLLIAAQIAWFDFHPVVAQVTPRYWLHYGIKGDYRRPGVSWQGLPFAFDRLADCVAWERIAPGDGKHCDGSWR